MAALPAPSLPAQWGHSGGHRVTQRQRGHPPPPPPPPSHSPSLHRRLPNNSVRQKAADTVSQRAGGGELESSITKQALCALPSRRRRVLCVCLSPSSPPSLPPSPQNLPSLPSNTTLFPPPPPHPTPGQSARCQQTRAPPPPRCEGLELVELTGTACFSLFQPFFPRSHLFLCLVLCFGFGFCFCFFIQGRRGGVGRSLGGSPHPFPGTQPPPPPKKKKDISLLLKETLFLIVG